MLDSITLQGVGPAPSLGPISFGSRVNLLTGDNGVGKTFLLDVAWWALTGSWAGRPAWPRPRAVGAPEARIVADVLGKTKATTLTGRFDAATDQWVLAQGRPPMPGLVLYFRVDGQFALWDPAQHYWRRSRPKSTDDPSTRDALYLSPNEAWNNIASYEGKTICRGLIEDWVTWQQTSSPEWKALCAALDGLSPSEVERLRPGAPMRVWLDDIRLHPTLDLPYGPTPVTLASAGMQRILMVAYLLVWAWRGHIEASKLLGQAPERRLVVLYDEPETHLHPKWQRRLLPSLLRATGALQEGMDVQYLVSTHSPLVLASMEPEFDDAQDRLMSLSLEAGGVTVESPAFVKRGDVVNWLVSESFGLQQARSVPAEEAVEAAERFMRGEATDNPEGMRTQEEIHEELLRLLGDRDPFWPRWIVTTGIK